MRVLVCIGATLSFAYIIFVPKKAIVPAALAATAGFFAYDLFGGAWAYFYTTLLIATISEILARVYKMPATVFLITGVVALIPGSGLFQTMLTTIRGQYELAGETLISTMLKFSVMAVAIAIVTPLFKWIFKHRRKIN